MANIICPHCLRNRPEDAQTDDMVCPLCGKSYSEKRQDVFSRFSAWLNAKDEHNYRSNYLTVAGAVILLLFFLIPDEEGSKRDSAALKMQAKNEIAEICKNSVRDQLKAPSTAQFANVNVYLAGDLSGADVHGHVDAQNSFGAMLRKSFSCSFRLENGRWTGQVNVR